MFRDSRPKRSAQKRLLLPSNILTTSSSLISCAPQSSQEDGHVQINTEGAKHGLTTTACTRLVVYVSDDDSSVAEDDVAQ